MVRQHGSALSPLARVPSQQERPYLTAHPCRPALTRAKCAALWHAPRGGGGSALLLCYLTALLDIGRLIAPSTDSQTRRCAVEFALLPPPRTKGMSFDHARDWRGRIRLLCRSYACGSPAPAHRPCGPGRAVVSLNIGNAKCLASREGIR